MTELQITALTLLVDDGDMTAKEFAKRICKIKGVDVKFWKRYLLAASNTLYAIEGMYFCFCYSGSFRVTLDGINKLKEIL